jgi:hypothetical protein
MKNLLLEIEKKRYDMHITAMMCGLGSKETFQLSQDLDKLLNIYNRELKESNT